MRLSIKFSLFLILFFSACVSFAKLGFESTEHLASGKNIKLFFSKDDPGQTDVAFKLSNGLIIKYHEMLGMGDFYEVEGKTIADGKTVEDQQRNFIGAFNSLALLPNSLNEANEILRIIHEEQKEVETGMNRGEKPEDIYKRVSLKHDREWNCITGGGCEPESWWLTPGRYMKLATQDFDHFGENAWVAYQIGHKIALQTAMAAHAKQDKPTLAVAYAMDAFASHFLSDRFAAGHMRTPRFSLATKVSPSVVGSVLAGYMHGEENHNGLHVSNKNGDQWLAFGDKKYFDLESKINNEMLEKALQESINQIFQTYLTGELPTTDTIGNMIPYPYEVKNNSERDIATLFYLDEKTGIIYRRSDVSNLHDKHWTKHWWGWSTLILLSSQRGIPEFAKTQLLAAGLKNEAEAHGINLTR